jgi:uncharacterized RDD family membrane protein YckC
MRLLERLSLAFEFDEVDPRCPSMNNLPRQKLCEIITKYGNTLCNEPQRCEAFLRDFCGEYRREIFILITALKEGITAELLCSQNSVPHAVLVARLTSRFQHDSGITEEAAFWAVESWALALGIIANTRQKNVSLSPDPQPSPNHSPPPPVSDTYRRENIFLSDPQPLTTARNSAPQPHSSTRQITNVKYAGFWKRLVAAWIDGLILLIPAILLLTFSGAVAASNSTLTSDEKGGVLVFLYLILDNIMHLLYHAGMESSPAQATLGKRAVGILVTDLQGHRISFCRASGRHLSKFLSIFICYIGFLIAGSTKKKQALHDMITGTLVVSKT